MSEGLGTAEREALERTRSRLVGLHAEHYRLLEDVAELERLGVAEQTGDRSTERLLAEQGRIARHDAKRIVDEARDLVPGTSLRGDPLPPRYPNTARCYAEGEIAPAHVVVVRRTMRRLERVETIAPDVLADAEAYLAEQATLLGPRGLQQAADQLLATLDPDGAAPSDEEDRWDELLIGKRRDGTMTLRAAIHDPADTALLRAGFDAGSTPAGPDDHRTLAQRQAAALKEFVAAATGPHGVLADDLDAEAEDEPDGEPDTALIPEPRRAERGRPASRPVAGAGRALLTITIDHHWLREALGHGTLDGAVAAHVRTVRRWACDAEIIPMVLGSTSEPLDVGRLARTVPDAIRRALNLRDGGCAFPGCDRGPRRCHAHHVEFWIDGGDTALDNLTLLCLYHHQLVHHGHWRIEMIDGRPWFVPPEWIDAEQRPRQGGRPRVPL